MVTRRGYTKAKLNFIVSLLYHTSTHLIRLFPIRLLGKSRGKGIRLNDRLLVRQRLPKDWKPTVRCRWSECQASTQCTEQDRKIIDKVMTHKERTQEREKDRKR